MSLDRLDNSKLGKIDPRPSPLPHMIKVKLREAAKNFFLVVGPLRVGGGPLKKLFLSSDN